MQVLPLNYSNTNSNKIPVTPGRNSTANIFTNNLRPTKKDNICFAGYNLKKLKFKERIKLRIEVINNIKSHNLYIPRERIGRNLFYGTRASFKTDYHLQLAQFLLKHKVMELLNKDNLNNSYAFNLYPELEFNSILTNLTAYTEKNEDGNQYVDEKRTKANAEAIMHFADFIVEHPIYNHKFVKVLLFHIISSVNADNINQRKFMANQVAKHPETLKNEWNIYDNLVTDYGYKSYKDMGYICGQHSNWNEEFYKTEDFKQSAYYKMFGTPNSDNKSGEELNLDSILNKVSSTKFKGLSQDQAEYLAKIMNIEDSSTLFKLGEDTPESIKLYRKLCRKYHPDVNNHNSESEKLYIIITTLRNG